MDERHRIVVPFRGAAYGGLPLTWGQRAILQDMRESGGQFSMGGMWWLPEGQTVEDTAARVGRLISRHAALRMRLGADGVSQDIAGPGEIGLDIVTVPDEVDIARYAKDAMETWPRERIDFARDWPLRVAVLRHRGVCTHLVWVLSHLAADGGAHLLLFDDLLAAEAPGATGAPGATRAQIADVARSEQTPQVRQLSGRAMRYWAEQLAQIPPQTFGPSHGRQYLQARFSSPAAHLAMRAIGERTRTDASRVTLAVIATAIGRATGVHPLTVKVTVNNRFRRGLADVIAPIAQNTVVTIDVTDTTVDEVVARARGTSLTAGMRAYYDPDALSELSARLDAERGYPARVTCRVNDQRAMIRRPSDATADEVTPERIKQRLADSSLTWLGRREHMLEQVNILVENRRDVVSLHMMWDESCLDSAQVEALLRGVEDVAVEAAFDPAAPTRV